MERLRRRLAPLPSPEKRLAGGTAMGREPSDKQTGAGVMDRTLESRLLGSPGREQGAAGCPRPRKGAAVATDLSRECAIGDGRNGPGLHLWVRVTMRPSQCSSLATPCPRRLDDSPECEVWTSEGRESGEAAFARPGRPDEPSRSCTQAPPRSLGRSASDWTTPELHPARPRHGVPDGCGVRRPAPRRRPRGRRHGPWVRGIRAPLAGE